MSIGFSRKISHVIALLVLTQPVMAQPDIYREPQDAAQDFLPHVEQLLDGLAMRQEEFSVRINRCDSTTNNAAFYIWAGVRGVAEDEDAASVLGAVHKQWIADGWKVYRFRQLENGGVNLAATAPDTGNTFQASPQAQTATLLATSTHAAF